LVFELYFQRVQYKYLTTSSVSVNFKQVNQLMIRVLVSTPAF